MSGESQPRNPSDFCYSPGGYVWTSYHTALMAEAWGGNLAWDFQAEEEVVTFTEHFPP